MFKFIRKQLKNKKGFTLVELVVVISILGILATIAVPKLSQSKKSAEDAALKATINTLNSSYAMYVIDNPGYTKPNDIEEALNAIKDYIKDFDKVKEKYINLIKWDEKEELFKEVKQNTEGQAAQK